MSQIEAFDAELGDLATLLGTWLRASQQTSEQMKLETQGVNVARADLETALASAERQSGSLHDQGQRFEHSASGFSERLDGLAQTLQKGLTQAGECCHQHGQTVTTASEAVRASNAASGTKLQTDHQGVGGSYAAIAKQRTQYRQDTGQHHQVAQQFLQGNQTRLKTEQEKVAGSADTCGSQLGALSSDLDQHLKGAISVATVATNNWLGQDMHTTVSGMVTGRLENTLSHLKNYGNRVQTFQEDAKVFGDAVVATVQKLTHDLPENLRKHALNPVLDHGKDLVINQLVETTSVIVIGAGISSACVGAMPALKVVSVTLKGLLAISSVAASGKLRADDPSRYEETDLRGVGGPGFGAGSREGGIIGAAAMAVGTLNLGLAAVQQGANQVATGVQGAVNQGVHQVQDFVHELFCPLCGKKCEAAA